MIGEHSAAELTADLQAERAGDGGASCSSTTIDPNKKAPRGVQSGGADPVCNILTCEAQDDGESIPESPPDFNPNAVSVRPASPLLQVDRLNGGDFRHIGSVAAKLVEGIAENRRHRDAG